MLGIWFPLSTEDRLERLARCTGRSKMFCIREAILGHLDEIQDLHLAVRTLGPTQGGGGSTLPTKTS